MAQEELYLKELEYYFSMLNKEEREAVYTLIKTMANQAAFREGQSFQDHNSSLQLSESEIGYSNKEVNKENYNRISIQQYNKEIEEAMQSIDDGESFSHEEVAELSKVSLNGK